MAGITYKYAYDESNNLIKIDEVDKETRKGRIFKCLSCTSEMIAKMGESKAPHFAHKHICDCNKESYIHLLGKMKFKEMFDNNEHFLIEYEQTRLCSNHKKCLLYNEDYCQSYEPSRFDLKNFYDTCTPEKAYGDFRADLLLEDSTGKIKTPVFIEILYKHKCTQEKTESGNKIIEIDVNDEDELIRIFDEQVIKGGNIKFINFSPTSKEYSNKPYRELYRFSLFSSGNAKVGEITDTFSCKKMKKRYEHAIFEVSLDEGYFGQYDLYSIGYVIAQKTGCNFKACNLCKYHRDGYASLYGNSPHFCCLHKKFGTPENPSSSDAAICQYYVLNYAMINNISKYISENVKYIIID